MTLVVKTRSSAFLVVDLDVVAAPEGTDDMGNRLALANGAFRTEIPRHEIG